MMEPTVFRPADEDEVRLFYAWIQKQFASDEVKPFSLIRRMIDEGKYRVRGLWRGGDLLGYAMSACAEPDRGWLLDYLAVLPEHQDKGYGGEILRHLAEETGDAPVVLEVVDPDRQKDEAHRANALRRIAFYRRNGCAMTGIRLSLYGVDYAIMALASAGLEEAELRRRLEEIYHMIMSPEIYRVKVLFR